MEGGGEASTWGSTPALYSNPNLGQLQQRA
jgi:hypothetical protein